MTSVIIRYYRSKPTRSGFGITPYVLTIPCAVVGVSIGRTGRNINFSGASAFVITSKHPFSCCAFQFRIPAVDRLRFSVGIRTAAVGNVDGKASGCGKGKFVRKRVVFGKVILIAFIAGTVVSVRRRTVEVSALAGRHTGTVGNRIHNTPAAGF